MEFIQREEKFVHHSYEEELKQYQLVQDGDLRSIEENKRMFSSDHTGRLSNNPLRNYQYLFVAAMTILTRFVIEGGMDQETAYNLSDLYIQKVDLCQTVTQVKALHTEMVTDLTKRMARIHKEKIYSKQIILATDYIYEHLHETITVPMVASFVRLNSSYLSTLFKKEIGISVSDYIRHRRIEAAANMLKFSDMPCGQIAHVLAFSSHSHFVNIFKKELGMTPKEYRTKYFRKNWKK
jgi:AraC-like DNA-binding protein